MTTNDTPDNPPPYITGPGPDYDPPPVEDLIDPAIRTNTHTRGARLVRQVLADCGITKTETGWTRTTTEGERP